MWNTATAKWADFQEPNDHERFRPCSVLVNRRVRAVAVLGTAMCERGTDENTELGKIDIPAEQPESSIKPRFRVGRR